MKPSNAMIVHGLIQQTGKSVRLDQTLNQIPVTNSCLQLSFFTLYDVLPN